MPSSNMRRSGADWDGTVILTRSQTPDQFYHHLRFSGIPPFLLFLYKAACLTTTRALKGKEYLHSITVIMTTT